MLDENKFNEKENSKYHRANIAFLKEKSRHFLIRFRTQSFGSGELIKMNTEHCLILSSGKYHQESFFMIKRYAFKELNMTMYTHDKYIQKTPGN